jgi:hypothetical protein
MVCVTYRGFGTETVTDCTLYDFEYSIGARWHVGHNSGTYGLLNLDASAARFLCHSLEQALRLLRAPLQMPPRLAQALQCLTPPFPPELVVPRDDQRQSMLATLADVSRPVGDQGPPQPPTPAALDETSPPIPLS